MLDLGPRARVVFATTYVVVQLGLIAWGLSVPDHVFGFQMFNESSRMTLRLYREVRGKRGKKRLLPLRDGSWQAPDTHGSVRTYRFHDRVRYRVFQRLGRSTHAAYGVDAQLFRLQKALDDVMAHVPHDTETVALVAVVDVVKNGRELPAVRLRGERR